MRAARVLACAALLAAALGGCSAPPAATVVAGSGPPPAAPDQPADADPARRPAAPDQPALVDPGAVVLLDAGHNGRNAEDPAAIDRPVPDGRGGTKACNTTGTATDAGYPEHAFTFDVTARVAQRLTAAGVRVVLTRTDDAGIGPCVDERGRAGEIADADAVVSIHADGSAPADRGFHVALSDPPLHPAQQGPALGLAIAVRDAMRTAGFPDSNYLGRDGLTPRADLAGLNLATRPTVLVECANMRNPAEAALVSSPEGRDRYAAAITSGVLAFLARGPQ